MVLVLLSPSKTLDAHVRRTGLKMTKPHFQSRAETLAQALKALSAAQLGKLMGISPKLAELNATRYADFTAQEKAPAVLAYQGDTYIGLNAADLSDDDLRWAQDHLGILSGLYGVLRPLDAMQPYRLEMGTKLVVDGTKDLYAYWDDAITAHLRTLVKKQALSAVIGCASQEYLSAMDTKALGVPFIQCDFKESKNGKLATVGLFAKRARGMMARYAVEHRVTDAEKLKRFNSAGYAFDKKLSDEATYVFVR